MKDIKPKMVEGCAVCQRGCPSCEGRTNWEMWYTCLKTGERVLEYGDFDDPCVPYYQAENAKMSETLKGVRDYCDYRKANSPVARGVMKLLGRGRKS